MPNLNNVESPLVIVGIGRSGTSLLTALFERHPDFSYEGEVANLIFGLWSSVETTLNSMPELLEEGRLVSPEQRAGRAVRNTFLSLTPTDRKHWCIKPIGIPRALTDNFSEVTDWDRAAEYYWNVMHGAFPSASYLTVLRHPCDVVISSCARWGHDPETMWWSLGFMAHILTHKAAPKIHFLSFDDLSRHDESVVRKLLADLQVPFHRKMLGAFTQPHATQREVGEVRAKQGSHQHQWQSLRPEDLPAQYRLAIERLFKRGRQPAIAWPPHFKTPRQPGSSATAEKAASESTEAVIARHLATIAALNRVVDKANMHCETVLLQQSRNFDAMWRENEEYIRNLSEAITWHEKQNATTAAELDRTQAKLVEATQWFEAHEAELRTQQEGLDKTLAEVRAWNEELTAAKTWHDRQIESLDRQLREAGRLAAEQRAWDQQQLTTVKAEADALRAESQQLRDWNAELVKALEWHKAQNGTLATQVQDVQRLLEEHISRATTAPTESASEIAQLRGWNDRLVEAKDWHAAQIEALSAQLKDVTRLAAEQKAWQEEQLAHALAATEAHRAEAQKLRDWNAELIKAKDWHTAQLDTLTTQRADAQRFFLEQKRVSDTQLAESQNLVQQLRAWNDRLVEAKDWHTSQIETLSAQLKEAARLAAEQRAWHEEQLENALATTEAHRAEAQKLREWNDRLVEAKDWHAAQNDSLAQQLREAVRVAAEQKAWQEVQLAHAQEATEAQRTEAQKLREWNDRLVEAKDWHAAQNDSLAQQLREAVRVAAEQKAWQEVQLAHAQEATEAQHTEAQKLREWNDRLVEAKDWHATQNEALRAQLQETSRLAAAQVQWLEQQVSQAQAAAESIQIESRKLREWNVQLLAAKDWHAAQAQAIATKLEEAQRSIEEQKASHAAPLAEAHTLIQQLQAWVAELVKAKDWHAAQNESLVDQLKESARLAAEQKAWQEQQLAHAQAAAAALAAEIQQLRAWNAELAAAKDWHAAQVESLVGRLNEADKIFREQQGWIAVLESVRK